MIDIYLWEKPHLKANRQISDKKLLKLDNKLIKKFLIKILLKYFNSNLINNENIWNKTYCDYYYLLYICKSFTLFYKFKI